MTVPIATRHDKPPAYRKNDSDKAIVDLDRAVYGNATPNWNGTPNVNSTGNHNGDQKAITVKGVGSGATGNFYSRAVLGNWDDKPQNIESKAGKARSKDTF